MGRAVKINPAAAELVTQSSILFNINFNGDPIDIYTYSTSVIKFTLFLIEQGLNVLSTKGLLMS